MNIRRYRLGEEPEIWGVLYSATRNVIAREYTLEQVERWAPDDRDMEAWRVKLTKTNPFVAKVGDRIAGFAELEPDGHIDCFYCHHQFQRQGVGAALMAEVFAEARRLGLTRLYAEVSTTAHAFFLANGFVVDEETNDVVCGQPAKQFHMSNSAPNKSFNADREDAAG